MPDDERPPSDGAVAVARRAPFSDNPRVGARGLRTQQRILDAALRAFAEDGYHGCTVERITKLARCSRVSFYQYFASKEDVFRQLAEQLARQLVASTEALEPLTPTSEGWTALYAWVARYAEIYARYEPVVHAYESDEVLTAIAARTGADVIAKIQARLATTTLPARLLDPIIRLLVECLIHTFGVAGALRTATPTAYRDDRVQCALTDVLHRTLFGALLDVNVHEPVGPPAPALEFSSTMRDLLAADHEAMDGDAGVGGTRAALVASGHDVFVDRGYHDTRVDDLVAAAGVSHGAFYRYFENKGDLARLLTADALRHVGASVMELPAVSTLDGSAGRSALRRWLKGYNAAHTDEAAMLRVWVDAALRDPVLRVESVTPWDWGRRRMSSYLAPRGFGDVDMDAVVMVALLGVFGARPRTAAEVDAAAHIIERGLLGR